jgi:hypothetical protein
MPHAPRDEEFPAFVAERRIDLLRSACLLTAGGTHLAADLVQAALARPRLTAAGPGSVRNGSSRWPAAAQVTAPGPVTRRRYVAPADTLALTGRRQRRRPAPVSVSTTRGTWCG